MNDKLRRSLGFEDRKGDFLNYNDVIYEDMPPSIMRKKSTLDTAVAFPNKITSFDGNYHEETPTFTS